jgi:hypothetical protein
MEKKRGTSRGFMYLSGSMEFAPDGSLGSVWRDQCSLRLSQLGYVPINITELDKAYADQHGNVFSGIGVEHSLQRKMHIRKHFVQTDLGLILYNTDALVVRLDEGVLRGAGTISECQFAYLHDIPIFVVNELPEEVKVSGWLYALTTKLFNDWESLYDYLDKLPYGILKKDVFGNRGHNGQYLCSLCGNPFTKHKNFFVSNISPLYCKDCIDMVVDTHTNRKDRYDFISERLSSMF